MELPKTRNLRPRHSGTIVLLAACIALSTGLVLGGGVSLWFDEALTVTDGWHPRGANHNPLFYSLVRVCVGAWGGFIDEWSLRSLSGVCALMCLPLCSKLSLFMFLMKIMSWSPTAALCRIARIGI